MCRPVMAPHDAVPGAPLAEAGPVGPERAGTPRAAAAGAAPDEVDTMLKAYAVMHRIRAFDLTAYEAHRAGLVRGGIHSYVGQEAIATGVSLHLDADDYVNSYHR